jgi:ribosomal protein L11 methyltransferase
MKNYKEFIVTTEPVNNELTSGLLWQLDIDGINETDNGLILFCDSAKNVSAENVKEILNAMIDEKLIDSYLVEETSIEDKNWNEEYEKKVRVIEVTDKIVIKPSFKDYNPRPDQVIITIDPKMSFGTGEHATTRLVMQLMEKYVMKGYKVLDVGSGTGVLGICAVMLGAAKSTGIDNDEWCLLNGNENVKANNLQDRVEIKLSEIKDIEENNFDLIFANINKHILLDIAPSLKSKLKKEGTLILSGLLLTDEKDIIDKYSSLNFTVIDKSFADEWCSLVLKND